MARDISDQEEDQFEKMDADSLAFLEQVRKGKARNFLLSMKGNKVRSMLVKKKSIKEKDLKAARGGGYQPVFGVVEGTGAQITFHVARSDGFDEKTADCKTEKLKKFLKEQTGKVFQPAFQLVNSPPALAFDDEDLRDPRINRFMKMEPLIKKACDSHPDQAASIEDRFNAIRSLLQDEETLALAEPKIDELVNDLKQLLGGNASPVASTSQPSTTAASTADSSTTDGATTDATATTKFAAALKKLKPLVDRAIAADANRQPELHGTMAKIAGQIKSHQFDQAREGLTEFAARLKSLLAETSPMDSPGAIEGMALQDEFAARRDALEPRLLQAQRANRDKATQLGADWSFANEQAQSGNFDRAWQAFEKLETAINAILTSSPGSPTAPATPSEDRPLPTDEQLEYLVDDGDEQRGVVTFRKAMLLWEATRGKVKQDINDLRNTILQHFPERTAAADRLEEIIVSLDTRLSDRIDDYINTESREDRVLLHAGILETIADYQERLDDGPLSQLINHVDANPFMPLSIRSSIESALSRLTNELPLNV